MVDELIMILAEAGYGVYRQGSFAEDQPYPDSFFTFWSNDSPDHARYDNRRFGTEWSFDINFYSVDPNMAYAVLEETIGRLEAAGWYIPSRGNDVRSDEPTHVGRGVSIYYLEV